MGRELTESNIRTDDIPSSNIADSSHGDENTRNKVAADDLLPWMNPKRSRALDIGDLH
jgi:hypothetical protein